MKEYEVVTNQRYFDVKAKTEDEANNVANSKLKKDEKIWHIRESGNIKKKEFKITYEGSNPFTLGELEKVLNDNDFDDSGILVVEEI
jgi:hypothetical protein